MTQPVTNSAGLTQIGNPGKQLTIALAGLVTTLGVVGGNLLFARWANFDFLSVSFWFVLPAGALIGGMGATIGYYFGAKKTQTMPTRGLLFSMLAIGVFAWWLSLYLDYFTLTLSDGARARDLVNFWQFFQVSAESTNLTLSVHAHEIGTTGELGSLGYVREALQAIAFIAGSSTSYFFLKDLEVCKSCQKYVNTTTVLSQVDPAHFQEVMDGAQLEIPGFVDEAMPYIEGKRLRGLSLTLSTCPQCASAWVRPLVVTGTDKSATVTKLAMRTLSTENGQAIVQSAERAKATRSKKPAK